MSLARTPVRTSIARFHIITFPFRSMAIMASGMKLMISAICCCDSRRASSALLREVMSREELAMYIKFPSRSKTGLDMVSTQRCDPSFIMAGYSITSPLLVSRNLCRACPMISEPSGPKNSPMAGLPTSSEGSYPAILMEGDTYAK